MGEGASPRPQVATYQERPHLNPVLAWERNFISIPNNNGPSGVQNSKPRAPRYSEGEEKTAMTLKFEENLWETNPGDA